MKAMALVLAAFVALAVLCYVYTSTAAPPAEMTEAEIAQRDAEVREELANHVDAFEDAMLRGDPAAVLSMYTSSARALWPGMNLALNEAQDFVVEMFQTVSFIDYDWEVIDLWVHEDAAYGIYEESETFQMERQEPKTEVWNCFIRWEQEDGVWKIDRTVCGPRDASEEG